jgi:surfactin synthase thioesterase subunit
MPPARHPPLPSSARGYPEWGQNDEIFIASGAAPYRHDIPDAEVHMLDTGHFALETNGAEMAALIREFLGRKISTPTPGQ